jgi:uncharacterized protein (DUF2252 family)
MAVSTAARGGTTQRTSRSGRSDQRTFGRAGGKHLTPAERAAVGAEARAAASLAQHAQFTPESDRADPVALLEEQAVSRVPELVPIRYGRMLVSPFTFYRGAAAVMAADLARTPVSGLTVQLCGDAHLSNFGLFASPERRLLFDVNDFDETYPGPWEWDVKRLAASLEVAARENGFGRKHRREIQIRTVRRYQKAMARFADMRELDVWYASSDIDELKDVFAAQLRKSGRKKLDKTLSKALTRDSMRAFDKLTAVVDGERRIVADPPLIVPITDLLPDVARDELEDRVRGLLVSYRRTVQPDRQALLEAFEFVDLARKVVGVGSVGTRCWIVLMRGRDDGDPLFLQVKEAQRSVLADHVGHDGPGFASEGERVVNGQRLMQAAGDIFLGWESAEGIDGRRRDFYVRQLADWKGSAVIEDMVPTGLRAYGELCGWTLARAHARSGDAIAISAYLGDDATFAHAVAEFSDSYADQNERDLAALKAAERSGRITVEHGL